ncbi:serine/threonine-protein phosphatase 6 regulatory ankyrin repeat subunit B-like [Chrysoperla carnea]|uniref:serine/threonine-protein phosphatase 6 regulatory ankyrin repeat subunit B-like n=1 Tax=Chrysoperla carnea TaxID=189513 RepID=UPI001D075B71|nr:serine/threonine-protein phosphatase 6 regulatory ankyrin repeat subunit B-like [Chrysoperla carnea]
MDSNSENMNNLHDLSYSGKLEQITKLSSIEKYINEPDSDGRTPLHLSCFQNHLNVAKYLINSNANVNCQDKNLTTPLHWGVFNNNIQLVQILIDKKSVIQAKDRNGIQPLHLASLKGNVQIIRLIMSKGEIHETVVDNQGISPLHLAAYCGNTEALEVLLEYFDVHATDNRSINALNLAASTCQTKSVQLLLKKGASTHHGDNLGRYPLHWAAVSGDLEMIKPLLSDYYDAIDAFKCTPLFLATSYGHDDAICCLLKKNHQLHLESGQSEQYLILTNIDGPDSVVNKNYSEISALPTTIHWAAAFCSSHIIEKLLDAGANIEELGIRHNTPLHTAAAFGNQAVIKLLLDRGADINAKDEDDSTALHWAIVHRHIECVKLLLEKDADTAEAMCWAAAGGDLNIVKLLHETTDCDINENDENSCDEYSRNPLMWAATCGHANVIEYLLDNGADISCYDVIHWCAVNGLVDSIKKLLELGVDVNESDLGFNRTALHWAAWSGNIDVVKFLLSVDGVEVNAVEDQGDLPIHYAVVNKHLEVIKLLIEHGSELNKRGDLGLPLCMAVRDGDLNIIKVLVDGGADVNLAEYDVDETSKPLQIALEYSSMEVVRYLLEKGAEKICFIHRLAECGTVKDTESFIKSNDINSVDNCLRTPLFYAVRKPDNLKYLISLGSNINHHDYLNQTPVYRAIEWECLESVKILIKEGGDLNYNARREGYTPLIRAIETENFELFKLIVDSNASITMRDDNQRTPLHHAACKSGNIGLNMMQYLLSKGAEINVFDLYGANPLYLAVKTVHYSAYYDTNVKYLLDNGAELNTLAKYDETTLTPLSYAVMEKNYKMVKLLILYGSDLCLDRNIINLCPDVSYLRLLCFAGLRLKNLPITVNDSNIQNYIKYVETNPFNLKVLCRIALRETLQKTYLRFVNNAQNVPNLVKQFLLFNSDHE